MKAVYITDIAVALPNAPVTNDDIEQVLGQVGDRPSRARRIVLKSNQIRSRHYAINPETGEPTHTNAELTAEAIRKLQAEDFQLEDIDCLACGTSLPDQILPNHAVMVHGELAQPDCEVIATAGICLAGMTAMKYAWMGVATGEHQNAVATGSEVASPVLRAPFFEKEVDAQIEALEAKPEIAFEKDFLRWMLSDGAGAVRMQPQPAANGLSLKIEWIVVRSYANEQSACMYSGAEKNADGSLSGWKNMPAEQWLSNSVFAIKQDVKQLNDNIVHYTVEKPLAEIVDAKQLRSDDIDYFLPHYSSGFFREKLAEGLNNIGFPIPYERWATNLTSKGNTGSASIYIMMEELLKSGRLQKGNKILCYVPESGRFSTAFMLLTVCDHQG
jgi:3-oxoacyl-[acyl-carrier-protein] synthase-3